MADPVIGTVSIAAGVACVVLALALALTRPRAAPRKEEGAPVQLRFSVVDIGGMRYFDVRTFPRDALIGYLHVDAAKASLSGRADASAYVWVMPRVFATLLDECEGFAKVLLLTRLRDPVPKPTPVFVYVDGWTPGPTHDVLAREAGVELALEMPRIIGPDVDTDVREMLDRAARGG